MIQIYTLTLQTESVNVDSFLVLVTREILPWMNLRTGQVLGTLNR
jgi:hypothetical protein